MSSAEELYKQMAIQSAKMPWVPPLQSLVGSLVGYAGVDLQMSRQELLDLVARCYDTMAPAFSDLRAAIDMAAPGEHLSETIDRAVGVGLSTLTKGAQKS